MKILYLCADAGIPVRGSKGAAIHVRALIDAFSSLGHDVTLVAARAGQPDGSSLSARLIESAWEDVSPSTPAAREHSAMVAAESVLREARAAVTRERFDLIYERYSLWSSAGAQLASETGLPYVAEVNAPLRLEASRYRSLVNAQVAVDVEARVLESATALVAVSEPLKQYLVERGVSSLRVHVLPNAVDDRLFHPAVDGHDARLRLGLDGKFVLGFVGTERPWHDLDTLIAAMAKLHSPGAEQPVLSGGQRGPYHLLLVGAFSDAVTSALFEQGLMDDATVLGPLPQADIPPLVAAMDLAVSPHPALPGFYFSPLKLFEYLACGRATVAADVPPIAAAVHDGSDALLYRPGDVGDLAALIAALAADPNRREALGTAAARQVLQQHTWIGNARNVLDLIGRPAPAPAADASGQDPIWDDVLGRQLYRASRLDLANASFCAQPATRALAPFAGLRVLKYWPGKRCVLAYEGGPQEGGAPDKTIVGKVFRRGKAQANFDDQKSLWADGFGSDAADGIVVAAPIAHIPEMNMFVQAYAPGLSLDKLLDAPDLEGRIKGAAAAISKLHSSCVRPRATYSLEDELANLDGWGAEMSRLRPELAYLFMRHLEMLHRRALDLPSPELVPVHRDFYYSQLLYSETGVTLIDLDLLALGDPAIDVANFAAHLQFLAMQRLGGPHALDRMKQLFVDEYLRFRPMPGGTVRLAFYEAATLFRLQHVALTRPAHAPFFEALHHSLDLQAADLLETPA